jgi:tRNA-intron endonuclease
LSALKPQIKGEVADRFVIVRGNDAVALRQLGHYGEVGDRGELVLDPVEAAYLLERGFLVVESGGRQLSFPEFSSLMMSKDPKFWLKYLIYSDLKRRGYTVKPGFSQNYVELRLYKRGAEVGKEGAKYLVFGVAEGTPIDLRTIIEKAREARNLRKELIIAVIDSQGEVCYYTITLSEL